MHFAEPDQIKLTKWGEFGGKGKAKAKEPFINPVRNYYMTNAICRASETMAKCSQEFKANETEMLEAAE